MQAVVNNYIYPIIFPWIQSDDDFQDLPPPIRRQGMISRRFYVLNVTFLPASSERDDSIHTNMELDQKL